MSAERRRDPRTEKTLPVKISKKGLDVISETRNISCSGVYCRVNKPFPVMSKVSLTLQLPIRIGKKVSTDTIKCNGVVVRSEPEIIEQASVPYQNVAIFFTELSKKDKNKIAQYVIQTFRRDIP